MRNGLSEVFPIFLVTKLKHTVLSSVYTLSLLILLNSLASRHFSLLNRILKLHNNNWIFNLGFIKAIDLTGYNE